MDASVLHFPFMSWPSGSAWWNPYPFKKAGRKPYFSPDGKVALMFLKAYTGLSAPKLMEQLNANVHYQLFCGIRINPKDPLTNYKLIDDIALELSRCLRVQGQQEALAEAWKPYMKVLNTLHADATCHESAMRYPTDAKLLWECIGNYGSGDAKGSIPNRIVSVGKPYVRPIVRGKEVKDVESAAKCNNIQLDGISFIEKLSFNAFNEGARLKHCVKPAERLFGERVTKLAGDYSCSGNENRSFCDGREIETSFPQKGRKREAAASAGMVRKELARVRATAMEGPFGTQKEHYGLKRINGRIRKMEILIIFFGIHTANAVRLAKRLEEAGPGQAA